MGPEQAMLNAADHETPSTSDVAHVRTYARAAVLGLALNATISALLVAATLPHYVRVARGHAVVPLWRGDEGGPPDDLVLILTAASVVAIGISAITFVRWLRAVFGIAPQLRVGTLGYSGQQVTGAFFIPIVNAVLPYLGIVALSKALEPSDLSLQGPDPSSAEVYRTATVASTAPVPSTPVPPVGAWWVLWLMYGAMTCATGAAGREAANVTVNLEADVAALGAALLAILVVRGIDARVAERHRRIANGARERRGAERAGAAAVERFDWNAPIRSWPTLGLRVATTGASLLPFAVACVKPALITGWQGVQTGTSTGVACLAQGWMLLFYGNPTWLANPLLFAACASVVLGGYRIAAACACAAVALGLFTTALVGVDVPLDEGGVRKETILSLDIGFVLWIASMLVLTAGAVILQARRRVAASRPP